MPLRGHRGSNGEHDLRALPLKLHGNVQQIVEPLANAGVARWIGEHQQKSAPARAEQLAAIAGDDEDPDGFESLS